MLACVYLNNTNHPNITIQMHKRFELDCMIRSIGTRGKVEWKYKDSIINSSKIFNDYNQKLCGFTSTMIINNFTTANEGLYTCNASQSSSISSNECLHTFKW